MDMQQMKAFTAEVPWADLATSDGKVVGVRPMGGMTWFGDELWAATFKGADKVAQVTAVPYAEYCFTKPDATHLRIAGPCVASEDADDKAKLFAAIAVLGEYFSGPDDPNLVVLRLTPDRIRYMPAGAREYEVVTG